MLTQSKAIYLFIFVSDLAQSRSFYEDQNGFNVIEENNHFVKYDAGDVIYVIYDAKEFNVQLVPGTRDNSNLIVFHVDDMDAMYNVVLAKGLNPSKPIRYEVGATSVFADPDGHRLTIYEPSKESQSWPSGLKIRQILQNNTEGAIKREMIPFGQHKLIYLFLFVRDYDEALNFYHHQLGLTIVEEERAVGVVKYDVGGYILTTHVEGADKRTMPVNKEIPKSSAIVFFVSDIQDAYDRLAKKDISFEGDIFQNATGKLVKFQDPNGHLFYLCEPSFDSMNEKCKDKIMQIQDKYRLPATVA